MPASGTSPRRSRTSSTRARARRLHPARRPTVLKVEGVERVPGGPHSPAMVAPSVPVCQRPDPVTAGGTSPRSSAPRRDSPPSGNPHSRDGTGDGDRYRGRPISSEGGVQKLEGVGQDRDAGIGPSLILVCHDGSDRRLVGGDGVIPSKLEPQAGLEGPGSESPRCPGGSGRTRRRPR